MSDGSDISRLIGDLTADLKPVRRLEAPWLSAMIWTCIAVVGAAVLFLIRDQLHWVAVRQADQFTLPGVIATGLTAVLAAVAAFQLSFPDRSGRWAILPLPALVAWIAINGLGCLAYSSEPGASNGTWPAFMQCLGLLLVISVPLSVAMIWMVRRAHPLRPVLVAILGGLATAGAAATLLVLVHPHDATALDLMAHAAAVAVIVGLNALLGGRLLAPSNRFSRTA